MKVYVAFRTDGETVEKLANGSYTKLQKEMKEEGAGAEFTVVLYDFKPNLANVCQAVMDVTELPGEWSKEFRINDQGQLREVK